MEAEWPRHEDGCRRCQSFTGDCGVCFTPHIIPMVDEETGEA